MNPMQLDQAYHEFISNLTRWIPEGIIEVNLELLEKSGLLTQESFEKEKANEQLPHYFHVIETSEKVTLFNHHFAIWIVPKLIDDTATTIVLIAMVHEKNPRLEVVFSTQGVYNTPKLILRLLKHYIFDVIDTEEVISSIKNKG